MTKKRRLKNPQKTVTTDLKKLQQVLEMSTTLLAALIDTLLPIVSHAGKHTRIVADLSTGQDDPGYEGLPSTGVA